MAIANRNYMDIGGPGKKTDKPKPLYTIPAKNSSVGSAAAGAGVGAIKDVASKMQGKKDSYTPPADTGGYTETVNVPSAEDSYAKALEKFYDKQAEALREQQRAAERAMQAKINQGVNTLEGQKPALGQQFQDSAQQAYIQYMQSQKALPQAMAAQGLNGGASESSLASLESNYGNNVNALQDSYNRYLNDIDTDIANLKASGDISLAENAGNYAQQLGNLYAQQSADQLALLKQSLAAGSGGGAGSYSTATKPRLTLDQSRSLLDSGVDSPEARSAYKYYTGVDYTPQLSNEGKAFANAMAKNIQNYQFSNVAGNENVLQQIAYAIQSQLNSGRITRQDAAILAQQYGIQIA